MQTRKPIVAGQFYPAQHDACVAEINEYLADTTLSESLPETIVAGVVPHAGWAFSGRVALLVFSAVKQQHEKVNTFVIFGAAHSYLGQMPAVYDTGCWLTPMGEVAVDQDLADAVLTNSLATSDVQAHAYEHSIEVQVPFIQYLFAGAKILPIITPPGDQAVSLGRDISSIIDAEKQKKIVCIGSTDLTHYGPRYGFEPAGTGTDAFDWAKKVNDKQFIDLALNLEPDKLLTNAGKNHNACGPGAAAAAVAAAKKLGKTKGLLLAHDTSNEIMLRTMGAQSDDSVGYAAIVF